MMMTDASLPSITANSANDGSQSGLSRIMTTSEDDDKCVEGMIASNFDKMLPDAPREPAAEIIDITRAYRSPSSGYSQFTMTDTDETSVRCENPRARSPRRLSRLLTDNDGKCHNEPSDPSGTSAAATSSPEIVEMERTQYHLHLRSEESDLSQVVPESAAGSPTGKVDESSRRADNKLCGVTGLANGRIKHLKKYAWNWIEETDLRFSNDRPLIDLHESVCSRPQCNWRYPIPAVWDTSISAWWLSNYSTFYLHGSLMSGLDRVELEYVLGAYGNASALYKPSDTTNPAPHCSVYAWERYCRNRALIQHDCAAKSPLTDADIGFLLRQLVAWAARQLEGEDYLQMLRSVCECLWVTASNAQEVRKLETITLFAFLWLRYYAICSEHQEHSPYCTVFNYREVRCDCIRYLIREAQQCMHISRLMVLMILAHQSLNRPWDVLSSSTVDEWQRNLTRRAREAFGQSPSLFWKSSADLSIKDRFFRIFRHLIRDDQISEAIGGYTGPYYPRLAKYIRLLARSSGVEQFPKPGLHTAATGGPLHYTMSPIPEIAPDSSTTTAESSTWQTGAHTRSRLSMTLARSTISSMSSLRSHMRLAERLRRQNSAEPSLCSAESMDLGSRHSSWSLRRVARMSWASSKSSLVMHDGDPEPEHSTMMDGTTT